MISASTAANTTHSFVVIISLHHFKGNYNTEILASNLATITLSDEIKTSRVIIQKPALASSAD